MSQKIVRGVSLILIPLLLATAVLIVYSKYLDIKISQSYNSALGRTYGVDEMNKGLALIKHNAQKDDLMIFGSSELDSAVPQNPSHMFPNTQLDADVDLIGRASVQSLLNTVKMGALSDSLRGKKVVLIVSLQWFMSEEIDRNGYQAHFSEVQFYQFMRNKTVDKELKQYVCRRSASLIEGQSSMEIPYLYVSLYQRDDWVSKACFYLMQPYYAIREQFLLLKDKHDAYGAVKNDADKPAQETIDVDWRLERERAAEMGRQACTNNDFYVDDEYYTTYLEPNIASLKNSYSGDLLSSKEFGDYEAFLKICRSQDLQPYLIFMPTNGAYYDYIGLDKETRWAFYDKLKAMAGKYNFPYLDLRDKEYEPYFMKDVMHLGWGGWLYVNEKITEHFS